MEVERYLNEIRDDDLFEQELNRLSSKKPLPFYNEASLPIPLYGIKPNGKVTIINSNFIVFIFLITVYTVLCVLCLYVFHWCGNGQVNNKFVEILKVSQLRF